MSLAFLYGGTLLAFVFGVIFLETLSRYTKIPRIALRKAGHVGLALLVSAIALYAEKEPFIIIGLGCTIAVLILRTLPLQSLAPFKRSSFGDVFLPLGIGLAALLAPTTTIFIVSMLVIGLADTAAQIVGSQLRSKTLHGGKTLAGSLAFFIVSSLILFVTVQSYWILAIAVVLSVIELYSPKGSDNVTVPVAAVLLLALL